jgi:hypothetical protein
VIRPVGMVLLLVLAGCGSTGPTDQERVEAALLRLSDFPPDEGWMVEPGATDDPAQADFEAAVDECEQELDPTIESRSADRDSDSFVRGQWRSADVTFVQVGSSAAVVFDEAVREELFEALESMVDCFATALQDALIAQAGPELAVTVSDPYSLDVSTEAERTEGHAIQLDFEPDTVFVDVVAIEEGPTLLYGSFVHTGNLTLEDEGEILAPAVERLKEL